MRRFKRILVAVPSGVEGTAVLRRSLALAKANGAAVKIYDALEPLPRDAKKLYKVVPREELERMLIERRAAELEALRAGLEESDVPVSVEVSVGTRFVEIIREVMRSGHDLVMKPAVGDAGPRSPSFGSTDLHLMRECPCAVWIVKPGKSRKDARILAAVDPDLSDEEGNQLNDSVMELATSLSEIEKNELHVVHAWVLYNEGLLRGLVGNLNKLVRSTRKTHRRALYALLDRYGVAHDRRCIHLLQGAAKVVIPELARRKHVSLIVMGTAARSGLPHFLIGNTAEDVLNQVDCSVLTVKAQGFVSPVTLEDAGAHR